MHFLSSYLLSGRAAAAIGIVAILAFLHLTGRLRHRKEHYVFAFLLGSALATGLLNVTTTIFHSTLEHNAYLMALAVTLMIVAWKLLFGPWEPGTKAAVLGTFVFWIALSILLHESG